MNRRLNRRQFGQVAIVGGLAIPAASSLLAACGGSGGGTSGDPSPDGQSTPASITNEPVSGGKLKVALTGEPPTLDIHQTTASIVALVGWHMYEPLFTWDANYNITPMLAESHEISENQLVHRIQLRPDVTFHNSEPLTAEDVIASIARWGQLVGLGASLLEATDEIVPVDELTLEFHLNHPFGTLPVALARANQGCAIYPASVIEASGDAKLTEFIGTGPYRFVERQPDRFIRLERFDGYAAIPGESVGYGGNKSRYLDEIDFIPVPDEAARIAGIQAGDYQYLESVSTDHFRTLDGDSSISVLIRQPDTWLNYVLNLKSPILSDPNVRKALQLALDHEPIMMASFGEGFYKLEPSLLPGAPVWFSEAGSDQYNQYDPDQARQLLTGSSYSGESLRFMTTQEIQFMYNSAVVARQQLEEVGFNVDLQVYDWATVTDRRRSPDAWEIYTASASFRPDPIMRNLTCQATGWWCNETKDELLENLQSEYDLDKRIAIWEEIQQLFYEDVPRIKIGDSRLLRVQSSNLKGVGATVGLQPDFSNAWLQT